MPGNWFPALRFRSSVSATVTVSVIRLRTAVPYRRCRFPAVYACRPTENVIFTWAAEFLRLNVILAYFFKTEHGDTVTDEPKRNAGNQAPCSQSNKRCVSEVWEFRGLHERSGERKFLKWSWVLSRKFSAHAPLTCSARSITVVKSSQIVDYMEVGSSPSMSSTQYGNFVFCYYETPRRLRKNFKCHARESSFKSDQKENFRKRNFPFDKGLGPVVIPATAAITDRSPTGYSLHRL